ncbi:MAG TPA: hypothetical protein VGD57_02440 [Candidatus Dormibacteraeota bacterium]
MSQPQDPDGKAKHEANEAAGTPFTQHREEEPRPSYQERSRTGTTVFVKVGAVVCSTLFLLGLLLSTHPAIAFGFTAAGSAGGQMVTFLMPLFGLLTLTFIVGWALQANQ